MAQLGKEATSLKSYPDIQQLKYYHYKTESNSDRIGASFVIAKRLKMMRNKRSRMQILTHVLKEQTWEIMCLI